MPGAENSISEQESRDQYLSKMSGLQLLYKENSQEDAHRPHHTHTRGSIHKADFVPYLLTPYKYLFMVNHHCKSLVFIIGNL